MPGKKSKGKKFIDNFEGTTFQLVNRSQRDPNTNWDAAPQHVLLEQKRKGEPKSKYSIDNEDNDKYLKHLRDAGDLNNVRGEESIGRSRAERSRHTDEDPDDIEDLDSENADNELDESVKRKNKLMAEHIQYGIYFDDDYDYSQHLRNVGDLNQIDPEDSFRVGLTGAEAAANRAGRKEAASAGLGATKKNMMLPSIVFESAAEMKVGLLNKAVKLVGPQVDVDPDIIEGLEDDFDFDNPENLLDDDFMEEANKESEDGEGERCDYGDEEDDMFEDNDFDEEETKSRFTNYSMSSAVTKRSEGLAKLDEHFETVYEEYDEDKIGGMYEVDIEPVSRIDFDEPAAKLKLDKINEERRRYTLCDVIQPASVPVHPRYYRESQDDGQLETMFVGKPVERYDCESIRSTRSTLYNHPKTIDNPSKNQNQPNVIRLTKPADTSSESVAPSKNVAGQQAESEEMSEKDDDDDDDVHTLNTFRSKDETLLQKKERKQAVRENRKMKREMKSTMKKVYKDEKTRIKKEMINLKSNLQCVQIV